MSCPLFGLVIGCLDQFQNLMQENCLSKEMKDGDLKISKSFGFLGSKSSSPSSSSSFDSGERGIVHHP